MVLGLIASFLVPGITSVCAIAIANSIERHRDYRYIHPRERGKRRNKIRRALHKKEKIYQQTPPRPPPGAQPVNAPPGLTVPGSFPGQQTVLSTPEAVQEWLASKAHQSHRHYHSPSSPRSRSTRSRTASPEFSRSARRRRSTAVVPTQDIHAALAAQESEHIASGRGEVGAGGQPLV